MSQTETTVVTFNTRPTTDGSKIGVITLNSEKSLNALSLPMIELVTPQLADWETDPSVRAVFLEGAGDKAFCAGGDIRKLYEVMKSSRGQPSMPYAEDFFIKEYTLDHRIHTYSKPLVVWGAGIVMGGGLGLMAGGGARLVTETSMIAMPEISIGLYPDVGASFFLNRMPQGVGLFLGLTGTRLNAADALYVGLADYFLPLAQKTRLLEFLEQLPWAASGYENKLLLKEQLKGFTAAFTFEGVSNLKIRESVLQDLGRASSIAEYLLKLEAAAVKDPFFERPLKTLKAGSPTSARVIFEQLKRSSKMTLAEAFQMEAGLTVQFALHHDFQEGIRALIIDKDQPKWNPATLAEVNDQLVGEMFLSPWNENDHPLRTIGQRSST